jgi:phosphoglycerate dehydrogenase-like enzyme
MKKKELTMESVNVVVTDAMDQTCLDLIKSVSNRVNLMDVSKLVQAEKKGDLASKPQLDNILKQAEIVYGFWFPNNLLDRVPGVRWIQAMSAGVDKFLDNRMLRSPVILTSAVGIHSTAISEFVLGIMLMMVKQSIPSADMKREKVWKQFEPDVLNSKTVGIVGLGHIGREIARLAQAFHMKVIATRRSVRQANRARYVDILLPQERMSELLAESDFVVVCLPLTGETRKLIGEKELKTMKKTAYFINIARGEIVDETALIQALEDHWIQGAGLDVFAREPLPKDNSLWKMPNAIFSPHIAGRMQDYDMRATRLFCENLNRYLNGKSLKNLVNKRRGY